MNKVIRKFFRNYRDYGPGIALRKTFVFLFQFIFESRIYRIYMIDLADFVPKPHKDGEFVYRFIGASDLKCVEQIEAMEEWLEGQVAGKLRNGGLCLVAMDNDTLAGFNIAAFGDVYMPLVKTNRVFRPGDAWSEQITVNNRYRGKGLGGELRYRMFEELKRRGFRKYYGGTLNNNQANLKLTRKVGFKEIADIEYQSIFGIRRWNIRKVV
jgi:ribosomal protein S18 acetylase RimI-like enzyme